MSAIDSRDAIYSISRSAAFAQPSAAAQPPNAAPDSDGDADRDAVAGVVGQNRPGGLVQGMLQSLDRLGLNASDQINPNADAAALESRQGREPVAGRQEFQAFTQSLLQALDQLNRGKVGEADGAAPESQGSDAGYGVESPYGDLPAKLRSLADAVAEGATASLPTITELQGSFQGLVSRLSQETGAGDGARNQAGAAEATARRDERQASLSSFLVSLSETLASQRATADLQAGKTGMLIDQTV